MAVFEEVRAYFSIGGTVYHSDPVSFNPLPDEIFEVTSFEFEDDDDEFDEGGDEFDDEDDEIDEGGDENYEDDDEEVEDEDCMNRMMI